MRMRLKVILTAEMYLFCVEGSLFSTDNAHVYNPYMSCILHENKNYTNI